MQKLNYYENDFCEYWIDEFGVVHEIFKSTFSVLNLEVATIITMDDMLLANNTKATTRCWIIFNTSVGFGPQ